MQRLAASAVLSVTLSLGFVYIMSPGSSDDSTTQGSSRHAEDTSNNAHSPSPDQRDSRQTSLSQDGRDLPRGNNGQAGSPSPDRAGMPARQRLLDPANPEQTIARLHAGLQLTNAQQQQLRSILDQAAAASSEDRNPQQRQLLQKALNDLLTPQQQQLLQALDPRSSGPRGTAMATNEEGHQG